EPEAVAHRQNAPTIDIAHWGTVFPGPRRRNSGMSRPSPGDVREDGGGGFGAGDGWDAGGSDGGAATGALRLGLQRSQPSRVRRGLISIFWRPGKQFSINSY